MAASSSATERIPRPALLLAGGDVLVVIGIVVIGELTHDVNPIAQPVRVVETVLPFLLGWILVAGLLGIYGRAPAGLGESLRLAIGTWFGAANVGLILRASDVFVGGTTWPFPLVITGFVTLGLLAWRLVANFVVGTGGESGESRDVDDFSGDRA